MAYRSPAYDGARSFGLSEDAAPPSLDLSERTPARASSRSARPTRPSSTVRRRRVMPSAPSQPAGAASAAQTASRTTKKVKTQVPRAENQADDKAGTSAAVAGLLVLLNKLARESVIDQSTIGSLKNRLFSGDTALLIAFNDYVTGQNKDELIEALYTAGPSEPAEPVDQLADEKAAPKQPNANGLGEDLMEQLLLTPARVDRIKHSLIDFKLSSLSLIEIWSAFESQAHLDGLTRREFVDCCVRLCNPIIELACKEVPPFQQADARMLERAVLEQALDRFFELLDRDSGGRVDLPELLVVLALLARGSVTRKLEFCFNVINSRGDDTLTFEELVRFLFACAVLFTAFTVPLPASEQTSAASPRPDVFLPDLQASVWAVAQGLFLLAASDLPNVAQYIADSEAGRAPSGSGGVSLAQFSSWARNPVLLWSSLLADAITLDDVPATERERALSAALLRKHRPDLLAKAHAQAAPSAPLRARAASPSGEEEAALVRELQGISASVSGSTRPSRSPLLSALSQGWSQPPRDSTRHRVPSPFSAPEEGASELARTIRRGIEAANNMSATASKARRAQQASRKGNTKHKTEALNSQL